MDLSHPISTLIPSLEGHVLRVLTLAGTPLTGSRVAAVVPQASSAGVRKALGRLERQGLLDTRIVGASILYQPNTRHLLWPATVALVQAAESAFDELIQRCTNVLATHHTLDTPTLAIYGSVARGDSTADSDVDLALVIDGTPPTTDIDAALAELTQVVEASTGNQTNIYLLTTSELRTMVRIDDPMVSSWLRDSRTITGPDLRGLIRTAAA